MPNRMPPSSEFPRAPYNSARRPCHRNRDRARAIGKLSLAMAQPSYRRHRFPAEIIQHAIWLYLCFTLSYRDVEEPLPGRGSGTTATTLAHSPGSGIGNCSLCHGDYGNANLLVLGADVVGRPDLRRQAEAVALRALDRFEEAGAPWPFGVFGAGGTSEPLLVR